MGTGLVPVAISGEHIDALAGHVYSPRKYVPSVQILLKHKFDQTKIDATEKLRQPISNAGNPSTQTDPIELDSMGEPIFIQTPDDFGIEEDPID